MIYKQGKFTTLQAVMRVIGPNFRRLIIFNQLII